MMQRLLAGLVCALTLLAPARALEPLDAADTTRIAKEAFIYGYPIVEMAKILRGQALEPGGAGFLAPPNAAGHQRQPATPADTLVVAPNVDTLYSHAWLDLRSQPVVVSIPPFEKNRYLALELFDLYTWIVGYVSPRTQGRTGGNYLIAAADWQGKVPPGIREVFRVPTGLALGLIRTQWLGAADLPRARALQDQIKVRTLSAYLGRPAPQPAPALVPGAPYDVRRAPEDPAFFGTLAAMLAYMPALPEDAALRAEFARIGLAPGQPFEIGGSERRAALVAGMREGMQAILERARSVKSSAELFGSREALHNDHLVLAAAALLGILGNAPEEYLGVGYQADGQGQPFDGQRRYRIHFAPDSLPPVDGFWSITVYTGDRLLYANPIGRHALGSRDLAHMVRDPDGGITLLVQHEAPEAALEANWLPVPAGPFGLTFRTYLPQEAIRDGRWRAPPVTPLP